MVGALVVVVVVVVVLLGGSVKGISGSGYLYPSSIGIGRAREHVEARQMINEA